MNLCRSCGEDFGSLQAFDRHRVGTHEYTYTEGAQMEPVREDGRRCLTAEELATLTDRQGHILFARNGRGAWSLIKSLEWARTVRSPHTV